MSELTSFISQLKALRPDEKADALMHFLLPFLVAMDTKDVKALRAQMTKDFPLPPKIIAEVMDLVDGNIALREIENE